VSESKPEGEELPPDDLEEEVPEPEEKKEPFVSGWDVVVLLVLALVGSGFWFWYNSAKDSSTSTIVKADSLYRAGNYPEAQKSYRAVRENASVISKRDDSLMYRRMDSLETFEEQDLQLANGARAAIASEDTALIRTAAEAVKSRNYGFVPRSLLDSLHL